MFNVLSVITSFAFIFYGLNVLTGEPSQQWMTIFAWVTLIYGVVNLAILSWARNTRAPWCVTAIKANAICYLGIFTMDTLHSGVESGLEIVGILLLAAVLWSNWFAVKKLVSA